MNRRDAVKISLITLVGACARLPTEPRPNKQTARPFLGKTIHGCVIHRGGQLEVDGLKECGVKHVRLTYYTQYDRDNKEKFANTFQWKLDALDAAGIETLIVVHDFASRIEVAATMVKLTEKYPGRAFQVGNEYDAQSWRGNHPNWFNYGVGGDDYARLMKEVVAACPNTKFVGMGIAERHVAFTQEYLDEGGPILDAWCIHTYGVPVSTLFKERSAATSIALGGKMPLWVTEYGINDTEQKKIWGEGLSLEEMDLKHADTIAEAMNTAHLTGVSRTYQYCYWDDTNYGFGLVRKDESRRPAWYTLKRKLATW